MVPPVLGELVERSADPEAVRTALDRLGDGVVERLAADPEGLAAPAIRVLAASRSLTRLIETDPVALDVLAELDRRPPVPPRVRPTPMRSRRSSGGRTVSCCASPPATCPAPTASS
jgi:hypothetical protein